MEYNKKCLRLLRRYQRACKTDWIQFMWSALAQQIPISQIQTTLVTSLDNESLLQLYKEALVCYQYRLEFAQDCIHESDEGHLFAIERSLAIVHILTDILQLQDEPIEFENIEETELEEEDVTDIGNEESLMRDLVQQELEEEKELVHSHFRVNQMLQHEVYKFLSTISDTDNSIEPFTHLLDYVVPTSWLFHPDAQVEHTSTVAYGGLITLILRRMSGDKINLDDFYLLLLHVLRMQQDLTVLRHYIEQVPTQMWFQISTGLTKLNEDDIRFILEQLYFSQMQDKDYFFIRTCVFMYQLLLRVELTHDLCTMVIDNYLLSYVMVVKYTDDKLIVSVATKIIKLVYDKGNEHQRTYIQTVLCTYDIVPPTMNIDCSKVSMKKRRQVIDQNLSFLKYKVRDDARSQRRRSKKR